jgi:hypothetical protein
MGIAYIGARREFGAPHTRRTIAVPPRFAKSLLSRLSGMPQGDGRGASQ